LGVSVGREAANSTLKIQKKSAHKALRGSVASVFEKGSVFPQHFEAPNQKWQLFVVKPEREKRKQEYFNVEWTEIRSSTDP